LRAGRGRRLGIGLALLVFVLGLADACWLEPRVLLLADRVFIPLDSPPLRLAHLSDLHVAGETPLLDRLLAQVAAARPDLVVVSGDLVRDVPAREPMARHTAAAAAFAAALRRVAPVFAVQGHSDHPGELVAALARAGVRWLSNEGVRIDPRGEVLLLGVTQQVGVDEGGWSWTSPFAPVKVGNGTWYGARRGEPYRDFYSHYDPAPAALADAGGPLAWSGYDALCDVWIDDAAAAAGIEVHSRYVLGEHRMIRLRRVRAEHGNPGSFFLIAQGTAFTGARDQPDTGVDPEPGRWYRLRLRTEVRPDVVRVFARVWPADGAEPQRWQAHVEDRSPLRLDAGTAGVWAAGGGVVAYRNFRVADAAGRVLLDEPLALASGERRPARWREGARGTRLALALARSPTVPPGTPRVVLSHTPDVVLEASRRGLEVVLAGHTHGGQVRLPGIGALVTRDRLGPYFDRGRFEFAAPNARGLTALYVNPGVGTSVLPIRFDCPPRWALVLLGRGR
jgi:predicted MPP superfamily phosphohydrolase